uniref:Opacity protein (Clone FLOB601) (Fragments) n=1 Tax=Neisseria gonorrhoeae TaxID=485 RepID=Q7M0T1_NEIGO
ELENKNQNKRDLHSIDSTKKITGTLTAYPSDADAAVTVYPDGHPQKNTY